MNRKIRNSMVKLMLAMAFSFVIVIASAEPAKAAGWDHGCVVTDTGGLKCWGWNIVGQVGVPTYPQFSFPPAEVFTSGIRGVSIGLVHTCAVTTAGGVKCWGANYYGNLGIGNNTDTFVPTDVVGLSSGVVSVSTAEDVTCALMTSGGVKCWGANYVGQLGNGTFSASNVPVDVIGLGGPAIGVTTSDQSACALLATGGVKCWGWGAQLGDGIGAHSNVPVDVVGLTSGVAQLSKSGFRGACAVTTGGGVKCWGYGYDGQLGDGTFSFYSLVPVDVVGLSGPAVEVSGGVSHRCALTAAGGVMCWGAQPWGALGNDSQVPSSVPVQAIGLESGVTQIGSGGWDSHALTSDGVVKIWGKYFYNFVPLDLNPIVQIPTIPKLHEHFAIPDTIAPEIVVTRPVANGMYGRGSVVAPIVSCTDEGGSGLATCNYSATLDTSSLGMQMFTVTASDNAGNTSSANVPYKVGGKDDCKKGGWALFLQPTFPNQGQCVSSFVP